MGRPGGGDVEAWQLVLALFFALLPVVLMLDFWGDERLTARGLPIRRPWVRQSRRGGAADTPAGGHGAIDAHASHGDLDQTQPAAPASGHNE